MGFEIDQVLSQLRWRYAVKRYDSTREISDVDWNVLLEAVLLAPSSLGLQPWKIVWIKDVSIRQQLQAASFGQLQIVEASHLLLFATKKDFGESDINQYLERISEVRAVSLRSLDGLRERMRRNVLEQMDSEKRLNWARNQTYIALGLLVTIASMLNIDATPMEGFDANAYDRILGLSEDGLVASAILALGYRSSEDTHATLAKVRLGFEEVVVEC